MPLSMNLLRPIIQQFIRMMAIIGKKHPITAPLSFASFLIQP